VTLFRRLVASISLWAACTSSCVFADDSIRLYFEPLAPLINDDGKSGQLVDALKEIELRSGIKIDSQVMPYNRSFRKIEDNEPVASVPYLIEAMSPKSLEKIQTSVPIAFRISLIWARDGVAFPNSLADIKQHTIASADSARLPPSLEQAKGLRIIRTYDIKSAIHILKRGRADIFINDYATTKAAITAEEADNISYDPHGFRFTEPATIIYAHSVEKRLIDKIDQAIISMAKDGTLLKLMPHSFVKDYSPYFRK
tara:strand:- start:336 stop:1100 length:765 start_codon:yes stop_codon:yes gene_type:complete